MRRLVLIMSTFVLAVGCVLLGTGPGAAQATPVAAAGRTAAVAVTGAVARPANYSVDELRARPQTTLADLRSPWGGTVTGVPLADLVQAAQPILPAGKNTALRVGVTVTGLIGARSVALGELDPGFGNHPALLAFALDGRRLPGGPWLAVPGDRGYARTVVRITEIRVSVADAAPAATAPGDLTVRADGRAVVVPAATLATLPQETRTVSFTAAGSSETHVESGPTLAAVLRAARVRTGPTTLVTAVATDGYAASVTPAEATSGRRPLLVSLREDGAALERPRLVTAGDVRGGRYVSGVTALDVVVGGRR